MDQINQLPSFDAAFSNLYSSSLGLADHERQFDTSEQQPTYRGMPVQAAESFPIHNSRSDVYQNEVDHSNLLKEYNIESLTNFDSENASGTDFPEIPQSILDECIPYESDNEPVNDALLLTPSTPFQQLILRDEPKISEQTPANHTRSVFQLTLTNLPAAPSNIEHLRPHEKVQDPEKIKLRNQRQSERYHEKVQDPEKRKLRNQRQRERRADPEKRKLINQRERERRADPEKRKLINQRERERRADPEKRKLINQRKRERYHEKVQDPEKRKLRNQRERERRADPEKRKLINQRERERRADPEKRKLINQRIRERYHEKVQDPDKRKLINQHTR